MESFGPQPSCLIIWLRPPSLQDETSTDQSHFLDIAFQLACQIHVHVACCMISAAWQKSLSHIASTSDWDHHSFRLNQARLKLNYWLQFGVPWHNVTNQLNHACSQTVCACCNISAACQIEYSQYGVGPASRNDNHESQNLQSCAADTSVWCSNCFWWHVSPQLHVVHWFG